MAVLGQVSHELEVKVPASKAWELYGSLRLATLAAQTLPDLIHKIEVLQGDGGVGTVLKLTFTSGVEQKEKFTKVDNEKRVKEVEVIEGGLLDFGLSLYRVRFEIIPRTTAAAAASDHDHEEYDDDSDSSSCITKTTIEYDVKEEADAANASSLVSIEPFANIALIAKNHLMEKQLVPN